MIKRKRVFILLNMLIPLITGGLLYYLISPDVLFIGMVDKIIGSGFHIQHNIIQHWCIQLIRNYLMDILWGYSLVFALYFISDKTAANLWKTLCIVFLFSAIMEFLQLTSFVKGTFDIIDILVEFLAEGLAVLIINKCDKNRKQEVLYEEQK